ncbi:hypothetical protein C7T94_18620 [Pedobacter yulinensis]|uniref:DUF4293 domain-containing protein n=1 Tax=Pedobacter yulinensis TaxID=2126353 RepID=A0A2T3HGX3_9SPHI|nr:DUF4293 domain-containing protein [Pedobacter yulinensis]PST81631.1 hypothetical protein C7T94_18620 [Pedobacter yulinensis]
MIQRIQSVWLLLACLVFVAMFFLPVVSQQVNGVTHHFYTIGISSLTEGAAGSGQKVSVSVGLIVLNIVLTLLCLVNIFRFRNRRIQKRVCIATIFLSFVFVGWCAVEAQNLPGGLEGAAYGPGAFCPAIAVLLNILAIRGINKDEKLIRSADRLR